MTNLMIARQSPERSRALIREARAARRGTLAARLLAALGRRRTSDTVEFGVVVRMDER